MPSVPPHPAYPKSSPVFLSADTERRFSSVQFFFFGSNVSDDCHETPSLSFSQREDPLYRGKIFTSRARTRSIKRCIHRERLLAKIVTRREFRVSKHKKEIQRVQLLRSLWICFVHASDCNVNEEHLRGERAGLMGILRRFSDY